MMPQQATNKAMFTTTANMSTVNCNKIQNDVNAF